MTRGPLADYLFGPSIDDALAVSVAGSVSYYDVDGLNSVSALNDSAGMVSDIYVFDVWGAVRTQTSSMPSAFSFTAREFGDVDGQVYFRARYHDSGTARFLSEDPEAMERGHFRFNERAYYTTSRDSLPSRSAVISLPMKYRYALNDPVNLRDPDGRAVVPGLYGPTSDAAGALGDLWRSYEERKKHPGKTSTTIAWATAKRRAGALRVG